jgi:hypothetical protein
VLGDSGGGGGAESARQAATEKQHREGAHREQTDQLPALGSVGIEKVLELLGWVQGLAWLARGDGGGAIRPGIPF